MVLGAAASTTAGFSSFFSAVTEEVGTSLLDAEASAKRFSSSFFNLARRAFSKIFFLNSSATSLDLLEAGAGAAAGVETDDAEVGLAAFGNGACSASTAGEDDATEE